MAAFEQNNRLDLAGFTCLILNGLGHEYHNHLIIHNRNLNYSHFRLQKWLFSPRQPLYNHNNPWVF
jgi:hypothetical protein